MRRYLLGFLGTFLLLIALNVLMIVIAFTHWFMQNTPLWFSVLYMVLTILILLAGGELTGRRPGRPPLSRPLHGLGILEGFSAAITALCGLLCLVWSETALLLLLVPGGALLMPLGLLMPDIPQELLLALGTLCQPLMFHLGWHWGRQQRS